MEKNGKNFFHSSKIKRNLDYLMTKRVTIMVDEELDKKLRLIQAKLISKTSSSVSYSQVLNDTLRKQLK